MPLVMGGRRAAGKANGGLEAKLQKDRQLVTVIVLNESVNRSLVTQNGVKFHPILHLVLWVIFLCQKIRKSIVFIVFFPEKDPLGPTPRPPGTPPNPGNSQSLTAPPRVRARARVRGQRNGQRLAASLHQTYASEQGAVRCIAFSSWLAVS